MPVNLVCLVVFVIVIAIDKCANSGIHSTIEKAEDTHQNP
ncbi:Uncharacterised protein [Citrobacter freundii]|nr:Uncharacterised protein [Citrobacter freundii]SUX69983.1 Uncharacterised protein [Citrobacter freundii]